MVSNSASKQVIPSGGTRALLYAEDLSAAQNTENKEQINFSEFDSMQYLATGLGPPIHKNT